MIKALEYTLIPFLWIATYLIYAFMYLMYLFVRIAKAPLLNKSCPKYKDWIDNNQRANKSRSKDILYTLAFYSITIPIIFGWWLYLSVYASIVVLVIFIALIKFNRSGNKS